MKRQPPNKYSHRVVYIWSLQCGCIISGWCVLSVKTSRQGEGGRPVLTRREQEILVLIAEGFTNPEMAEKHFVIPWTVDSHRKSIMTKLNTKNTALLVKYAMENGLL